MQRPCILIFKDLIDQLYYKYSESPNTREKRYKNAEILAYLPNLFICYLKRFFVVKLNKKAVLKAGNNTV